MHFQDIELQKATSNQSQSPFLPRWLTFGIAPFILALAVSMAVNAYLYKQAQSVTNFTSSTAQKMGLSDLPGKVAPGFTLTDQNGKQVSLSVFRGKAVLLAFMDSKCTEVCPVLAQEFLLANHDLGADASKVAFVGVNVNPMSRSVADVKNFTQMHGLSSLSNWYFLTGPVSALKSVWSAYGIEVILPKQGIQTVHAAYLYFIGREGHERYLASPQVYQRSNGTGYLPQVDLNLWGHGIATYIERVLSA